MKKVILALSGAFIMATAFSCDNAASKIKSEEEGTAASTEANAEMVTSEGSAAFQFDEEVHAFGNITEGTVAKHDFFFKNTGDAPLIITNAQGSCGCTVPEWPREPIAPGETGKIHVEFNSQGRVGNQQKQVTLTANTQPNTKVLRISAQVEKAAGEAAAAE